jgi:hypothetical protein
MAAATTTADTPAPPAPVFKIPTIPGQTAPIVPVSLELDGTVYDVNITRVEGGTWKLADGDGASWLVGTTIHPVFCVSTVDGLDTGDPIVLWDAAGTVRRFRVERVRSVARHQIDVLAQRTVGLSVLACGGTSTTRTLVTATYQP